MQRMMVRVALVGLILGGCMGAPAAGTTPISPTSSPNAVVGEIPEGLVSQARSALARHLSVPEDEVDLRTAEPVQWPTAGLGCLAEDTTAAQVITPGYRITLMVASQTYALHTDATGGQVVLCQNQQPTQLR